MYHSRSSAPPSDWRNVKNTKTKARALYTEICNVGKNIEGSKKRVTWRISVNEGQEHEISLTHSLGSGKKVLRVDGSIVHTSKSLIFGEWDYMFTVRGGHMLHVMIKPSRDLNDMYDLIVDDVSFRRLPDNGTTSSPTRNYGRPQSFTEYRASESQHSSPSTSWQCSVCTLINEKPHAIVCEACETPRAHSEANPLPPEEASPPTTPKPQRKKSSRKKKQGEMVSNEPFDPFGTASVESIREPSVPGFDPFESSVATNDTMFNPFETEDPRGTSASSTSLFDAPQEIVEKSATTTTESISDSLAGLDFSPQPIPEQRTKVQPTSIEATPASAVNDGDLWSSNIVSLDLSNTSSTPSSISNGPSMEQARQMASPKPMVPVMPLTPVQMQPQYHTAMPPLYYNQQPNQHYSTQPCASYPITPIASTHQTNVNDPFAGLT